jgi:Flp pilus assembly protein TadG
MVELAISLLVFLLLTVGCMEFGWAIYAYNSCSYAAQSGARWASVNGSLSLTPATQDTLGSYVKGQVVAMDPSLMTVTGAWTPNNNPGSVVKVTVGYTINPLLGLAVTKAINVSSTAQFVINH